MKHELKIWPEYFKDVLSGAKTFEIRKNDRDFKVGDELILNEYEPQDSKYSGLKAYVEITYILKNNFLLKDNHVGIGFKLLRVWRP